MLQPSHHECAGGTVGGGADTLKSGFSCDSVGRESAYNAGDLGLIPGLGRSPGEGIGYPLQYSGLENSMCGGVGDGRLMLHISLGMVM